MDVVCKLIEINKKEQAVFSWVRFFSVVVFFVFEAKLNDLLGEVGMCWIKLVEHAALEPLGNGNTGVCKSELKIIFFEIFPKLFLLNLKEQYSKMLK